MKKRRQPPPTPLLAVAAAFAALFALRDNGWMRAVWGGSALWGPESVHHMFHEVLFPAFGVGLFALSSWGIGDVMLRFVFKLSTRPPSNDREREASTEPARPFLGFAIGAGIQAWLLMWTGLIGGYNSDGLGLVLLAGSLAAWPRVWGLLERSAKRVRVPMFEGAPPWKTLLLAALAWAGWHFLATGLAAPTAWDALAHHLALPKLYLQAGRILEIASVPHSHWPHLADILYGVPVAFDRPQAASFLHAMVCLMLALAVFQTAKRHFKEPAAWLAAALVAAQPAMLALAGTPHADGWLALYHFLACVCLWQWNETGRRTWLVAGGLLSGLGACMKLPGLALLLLLAVWIQIQTVRKHRQPRYLALTLFFLPGFALVAPLLFKTWWFAHNPVWPWASWLFGGAYGAPWVAENLKRINAWHLPEQKALLWNYGPQYLLVPCAGLWWLARKEMLPKFLGFLFLPMVPYLLLFMNHHEIWRYMMPFYPAFALTAGWGLSVVLEKRRGPRLAAFALSLVGLLPLLGASQNNALFFITGMTSKSDPRLSPRQTYLAKMIGEYDFLTGIGGHLARGDKVLLFREVRGFLVDADYLWADPPGQGLIRWDRLESPRAALERLKELGVTHVALNRRLYADPGIYPPRAIALMEGVLRSSRLIFRRGAGELYTLP